MNETKLKRIGNHIQNRPKDKRMTLSSTVNSQLQVLKDRNESEQMNDFLLKAVPYIKRYSEVSVQQPADVVQNESSHNLAQFINPIGTVDKGKVYRDFMENCMNVITEEDEPNLAKLQCLHCNGQMLYIVAEAESVCEDCGIAEYYQDFGINFYSNMTTVSNGEIVMQFPYKRVNHLREWLSQVQGKENTVIPDEVIIAVMRELKKERIYDEDLITFDRIKGYLKKNGYSKYYEHVPIIINKICRKNTLSIDYETEQLLIEKFCEIQSCFEKYRPKNRKNFLSYSFTLHKLCQILGKEHLLPLFPLLKSRYKLLVQDDIWKKICDEKGWTFIPTI